MTEKVHIMFWKIYWRTTGSVIMGRAAGSRFILGLIFGYWVIFNLCLYNTQVNLLVPNVCYFVGLILVSICGVYTGYRSSYRRGLK